jgi:hypothetical protein
VFPERRPLSDLRVYSVPEPQQRPLVYEVAQLDDSEFKPTVVGKLLCFVLRACVLRS